MKSKWKNMMCSWIQEKEKWKKSIKKNFSRFCLKIMEPIFFFSKSFSFTSRLIFLEDILCYSIPNHKDCYLKHVSDYSLLYTSLQILVWLVKIFTCDKIEIERNFWWLERNWFWSLAKGKPFLQVVLKSALIETNQRQSKRISMSFCQWYI